MGKDQELLDAARSGNVAVVDKILSQRAKRSGPLASLRRGTGANVQDSNGYTPLHHAALNGHKEIVRLLLASDASPGLAGCSGATPLHLAAWAGHADIVRALLSHPVPPHVDQTTKDNETALQMAAQYGHTAVVAQLLARSADPAIRNVRDDSALDLAAQYGRLETVEMLVRTHPQLLEAYRLPGARSRLYEHTPLHRASRNGHKEVVAVLVAAGVDVNARTSAGTALHEAALCGKARVVRALLARGADSALPDACGRTPLDLLRPLPAHATANIVSAINKHRVSNGYDSESEDLPAVPIGEPGSPYDNVRPFPSAAGGLSPSQLWDPRDEDRRRTSAVSMDDNTSSKPSPKTHPDSSSSLVKHIPNKYMHNLASKCFGLKKSKSANDVNVSSFHFPFKDKFTKDSKKTVDGTDASKSTSTIRIGRSRFFKRRSIHLDSDDDDDDEFVYVPGDKSQSTHASNDGLITLQRVHILNRSKHNYKSSLPNISEKTEFASLITDDRSSVSSDSVSNSIYTSGSVGEWMETNRDRSASIISLTSTDNGKNKVGGKTAENLLLCYAQLDFTPVVETVNITKIIEENEYELYDFQDEPQKATEDFGSNKITENMPLKPLPRTSLTKDKPTQSIKEPIYINKTEISSRPEPLKRTVFLKSSPSVDSSDNQRNSILSNDSGATGYSSAISGSTSSYDSILDGTRFDDILNSRRCDSFVYGPLYENVNPTYFAEKYEQSHRYFNTISSQHTERCDSEADDSEVGYLPMGTIPKQCKVRRFSDGQIMNTFFVDRNLIQNTECIETKVKSLSSPIENITKFDSVPKVRSKRIPYHMRGSGDCIYEAPDSNNLVYVLNRRTLVEYGVKPFYKVSVIKVGEYDRPICFCDGGSKKMHMSAEDLYAEIQNTNDNSREDLNESSFICYCDSRSCYMHNTKRNRDLDKVHYSRLKQTVSFPNLYFPESPKIEPKAENHYAVFDLLDDKPSSAASNNSCQTFFSLPSSDFSSLPSSSLQSPSNYYSPTDSFRFFSSKVNSEYINMSHSHEHTSIGPIASPHVPASCPSLSSHGGRSLFHVHSGLDYSHPKYFTESSYNSEELSSSYREPDRVSICSTASSTGPGAREPRQRCGTSDSSVSGGQSAYMSQFTGVNYHAHSPGSNNKVSPTPPKKPPRRNLSVSPTHGGGAAAQYTAAQYLARAGHARSQDDLDDFQAGKQSLRHGRSADQCADVQSAETCPSPRARPTPRPRPSLAGREQPIAISAMYENVVIKAQNPKRKLRRNHDHQYENCEPRRVANCASSQESLLDGNAPGDGEVALPTPLSPTHYNQPPTPDHPPPSATQAEKSIHERIRPLSQEYKRRSCALRDSTTETELHLLRAASSASVTSAGTDCVEEFVCDVPFAGLFKGSTTTLDGLGARPTPAERPKTLKKLKNVYEPPISNPAPNYGMQNSNHSTASNGNHHEKLDPSNLLGDEVIRRVRTNTTSSNQSCGDKSLSILSPFDEQEEWAKISEIMASFGTRLVRESVFVTELEQEFQSRLGLSCSESSLSASVGSATVGQWLATLSLADLEGKFMMNGFDELEFINDIMDEIDLKEMSIDEPDRTKILENCRTLPSKINEVAAVVSGSQVANNKSAESLDAIETVDSWLRLISLEQYSDTFRRHLYVDMERVKRIWEVELTAVLEIHKIGHRKRILASVSGQLNGPISNIDDINADLNLLKNNIHQLKEEIKIKLPSTPAPPPSLTLTVSQGGETLKRSHKKNRPAPPPPKGADLEIRAPSELLVGVPGALKAQWRHQPLVLVSGAVTYVANYLGSTVVKELKGTESTKKSIQKLKKATREPRDSPDIILSISYRGVKFLNTITRDLVCEHEIRNIHCACQDADDLTHFAYITKDHATKHHYCHVFCVATMDQATEVILTLGEAFEVAYQMALREQFNVKGNISRNQPQPRPQLTKSPTHDPTTITSTNKDRPNPNHGRSHSIAEIKLNGHQLKVVSIPGSLSNEDFQTVRNGEGAKSPRTPVIKAPIASTEEL